MKRIAQLANARSGSCLFTFLLNTGFDLSSYNPYYPSHDSIFAYRVDSHVVAADPNRHNCKGLFIIRDPRDVVTSVHPRSPDHYARTFDHWVKGYSEMITLDISVHQFKYEDLIEEPLITQVGIADFLEVECTRPFDVCYKYFADLSLKDTEELSIDMGGVNPLLTTRIGRWREDKHEERVKQQLAETPEITRWLIQLGYEDNDEWTRTYI